MTLKAESTKPNPVRRRVWALAVPLALSAIVLAACASGTAAGSVTTPAAAAPDAASSVAPAEESADATTTADAAPAVATPEVLDFTGTTVDGAAFAGADLTGKPVVMWFWAPWCTVCRAESPDVAKVAAEFEGKVTFVGIAGRGPVEDMQAFVDETSTGGFTHVADVDGSLWARFGVIAQPSFVFVTPSGEAQAFTGGLGAADLRDVANQLLAL
jgi:thiol-disulfide isomerase/thioredoxin